ncbi:ATP-binding cassette domain-containing protein, partial [Paracraurococcus ruber]|uniref:ATP-binding cassette domain-containing protein n=1 Tax=Paracraurococcus ruber TaxID=77675 RepID=UPI001057A00F
AALLELGRRAGLVRAEPAAPPGALDAARPDAWVDWAAARLGLEAEPVRFPVAEAASGLPRACPALLALHDGTGLRFLLLLRARGRDLLLIGPDLRLHRRKAALVAAAATSRFAAAQAGDIDRILAAAGIAASRQGRARAALLRDRSAGDSVAGCWLLRLPPTAPFAVQLVQAGLHRRLGAILGVMLLLYGLEVGGWALIGAAALDGRLDLGWLAAWLLLLLSGLPLRLAAGWLDAGFALDLGRLLKRRLLAGALRLDPDAVRQQGAGQLLGRVIEAQALETLAVAGGLALGAAAIELGFAAWILAQGAGGPPHLLALLAWLGLTLALCVRQARRLRAWSAGRLDMTHALIERMVGHRTCLAQDQPARRDAADDAALRAHLGASRALDSAMLPLAAGPAGGWAILSLAAIAPGLVGGGATAAQIGISLGGILLANRAFAGIAGSAASLAQAGIAWDLAKDLFRAGGRPAAVPPAFPPDPAADPPAATPVAEAGDLVFRYRPGGPAVLRGLDLVIRPGERILLQAPSGGGKSTLAALLTGLRRPDSGLLLLRGLDRQTLGDAWHALATAAPQFHENHILAGTLAFNLLLGRAWPPSGDDVALAREVCGELGLGGLLERMPGGLQQRVGETGWQLSHGERSRIFLARALLQGAPLTILDESFAALDPETLQLCLDCARRRARGLVVIAHP